MPPSREDDYGVFAVDLGLERVTIDQGVALDVFADGRYIQADDRPTKLINGRNAYVRAFWTIPEDWEPREIEARLRVHLADGSIEIGVDQLPIEGPANEKWFEGAFGWLLPGVWVDEETELDVTFYEVEEPDEDSDPPEVVPRAPPEGSFPMGVSNDVREIDVHVVRIKHDYDGGKQCEDVVEVTDELLKDFEGYMSAVNPLQKVNLDLRDDVISFTEPATNFGVILDMLSDLREQDGAPPYLYYYGLIDLCDWGSDQGFSGQARVPGEITPELAWKRVAVGSTKEHYQGLLNLFVHEVGHSQGRYHVPACGEKATVEDYPYRDALTASVGLDLTNLVLHPRTHHDYMSYCDPHWVGEYGWNSVLPVIETLTDWRLEGRSLDPEPATLVGSIYPDGTENWWTVRGDVPVSVDSTSRLVFHDRDGEEHGVMAQVRPHALGESLEVIAPLPLDLAGVERIERVGMPGPASLDPADISNATRR